MNEQQYTQGNSENWVEDEAINEEKQSLENCVAQIEKLIAADERFLQRGKDDAPVTGEAASSLREMKVQNISNMKEARPNPYFGRVNFNDNETPDKADIYYFGKYHIPIDYVYNWTAPIGNLFYNPHDGSYSPGAGRVFRGQVTLKREFTIENAELLQVFQPIPLPSGVEQLPKITTPLTEILSGSKGIEAQDIVATIQPKQYDQIVAALQQVMIIQGVPGSGKSEVGLHRVAYLLSPFNALNLNIEPERVVVFGPSRAFLRYVSRLLPSLNINRVRQTTVNDWLLSIMSSRPKLERRDKLFDKQLRTNRGLEDDVDAAKIKVSLQMARVLERYISLLRKEFANNVHDLSVNNRPVISKTKIRQIIRQCRQGPLNAQRNDVLTRIQQHLQNQRVLRRTKQLPQRIIEQFNEYWPELDYKDLYIEILSNSTALIHASQGYISENQATIIAQSIPKKSQTFQRQDLPALCYCDYLLNGREYRRTTRRVVPLFEHIVIDEAQDISPLEFYIIRLHSRSKSFTILGDIGQYIMEHRGISNWREVRRIFNKESVRRWDARISYRATRELTKYANRVLKTISPKLHKATPYKRHGERPVLIRSKSYADMVSAIISDIRSLREEDVQTIAVLCKTTEEATKLHKRLANAGLEDAILLDKQQARSANVIVASIYQTKGIEYDAVILSNARMNNYPDVKINSRLLYIAVTRAAHRLHIHWFGTLANILADPALLPKVKRAKVKKGLKKAKHLSKASEDI